MEIKVSKNEFKGIYTRNSSKTQSIIKIKVR